PCAREWADLVARAYGRATPCLRSGHDRDRRIYVRSMLVELALVLAGVAVLAAVVFLALGRGRELGEAHPDHPPRLSPAHRRVMGTDAALIRLPKVFWGYHVDLTDEALRRLAYALTERDTRVARLEQQLADARRALEEREHRAEPDGAWFAAPT